jgi:hypothetical protein
MLAGAAGGAAILQWWSPAAVIAMAAALAALVAGAFMTAVSAVGRAAARRPVTVPAVAGQPG